MTGKSACSLRDEVYLFEVMVAMLMLGMVSMMLYSVLNVSIQMSAKGEKAIDDAARQHGIMRLLHDQVLSAYYDSIARKVLISGEDEILRLVTSSPCCVIATMGWYWPSTVTIRRRKPSLLY